MMEKPLRFCMVTTFYPPYNFGGDGIFVHRLANELARRGHRVDVVHCADAYAASGGGAPRGTVADHRAITVHRLESPFGFLSPLATHQTGMPLFKTGQLRKIFSKGFDVIHYHNISLVGGPGILEYRTAGDPIKLYTLHEYWLVCPAHLLFKYNRAPCTKKNCITCLLVHRRPPQWWRFSTRIARAVKEVDAFINLTAFSRDVHREHGLDLPFVHLPFFHPDREEPASPGGPVKQRTPPVREPYFLFAGRLEKLKGMQTLIPVFRRFPAAQLIVAGTGSLEHRFRKLAGDCPTIRFLGHLPHDELQELYRSATAVIVPSLYCDISPLVIIEAVKNRTPVIVRNLGGMPELVRESGGGMIYNSDDDLIAAMERLLADRTLRDRLGEAGFETYSRNWTATAHVDRYIDLVGRIQAEQAMRRGNRSVSCHD